jgi:AcrR family transcriptional regulator
MLIVDSAISVLAARGARGLTHRAVDKQAGLSPGSTSYYFRTRAALVEAANTRLVQLDSQDVTETRGQGGMALMFRWLAPEYRPRLVARFELFLDATRNPSTMRILDAPRNWFFEEAEAAFAEAGAVEADVCGAALMAALEGLLISSLVGPRRTADEVDRIVRTLQIALIRNDADHAAHRSRRARGDLPG